SPPTLRPLEPRRLPDRPARVVSRPGLTSGCAGRAAAAGAYDPASGADDGGPTAALARRAVAAALPWTPTASGEACGGTVRGVVTSPAARARPHPSPGLLVRLRGEHCRLARPEVL